MAQSQTDGINQILDPLGLWKTSRDANLDAWSKIMVDVGNSEDYARSTGMMLDQYLAMSQPFQDAVQKSMTSALAYLNMPTRAEVISLATQSVNIETRLDDLDAKTSDMRDEYRNEIRGISGSLDKAFTAIMSRLDALEATMLTQREKAAAKPEPKAEAKPDPKTETKK